MIFCENSEKPVLKAYGEDKILVFYSLEDKQITMNPEGRIINKLPRSIDVR